MNLDVVVHFKYYLVGGNTRRIAQQCNEKTNPHQTGMQKMYLGLVTVKQRA